MKLRDKTLNMSKAFLLLLLSVWSSGWPSMNAETNVPSLPEKYNQCLNGTEVIRNDGICGELWAEELVKLFKVQKFIMNNHKKKFLLLRKSDDSSESGDISDRNIIDILGPSTTKSPCAAGFKMADRRCRKIIQ